MNQQNAIRNALIAKVEGILTAEQAPEALKAAAKEYLDTVNDGEKNTAATAALVAELEKVAGDCEHCASILREKEFRSRALRCLQTGS